MPVDELDARLLDLLADNPRMGVLECSRRLGVARGTVQARLDRLARDGVVTGFGPDLDPVALGFPVTAFVTLQIVQGQGYEGVAEHLSGIPEVLAAHTISGAADMMCLVVARSNADLQRVLDRVVADPSIQRSSTTIALANRIPHRVLPLLHSAARYK
jgi:DNA-binding Lrp family transcriptional regulator